MVCAVLPEYFGLRIIVVTSKGYNNCEIILLLMLLAIANFGLWQ